MCAHLCAGIRANSSEGLIHMHAGLHSGSYTLHPKPSTLGLPGAGAWQASRGARRARGIQVFAHVNVVWWRSM